MAPSLMGRPQKCGHEKKYECAIFSDLSSAQFGSDMDSALCTIPFNSIWCFMCYCCCMLTRLEISLVEILNVWCAHTVVFQGFQSLLSSLLSLTHKVKVQAISVLCSYMKQQLLPIWVWNPALFLLCIESNLQGLELFACKPHYCGRFKALPFFICPHISLICHSRIPLSIVYFASEIYALCSALHIMHSKALKQQMLMY